MPRIVLSALFLLLAVPATAHELWLEPMGADAFRLHWGHSGHGEHAGQTSLPYAASDVVEAWGATAGGELRRIEGRSDGSTLRFEDCGGLLAVQLDAGTWVKTVRGTVRGRPQEVAGALESWRSWASLKRVGRFDVEATKAHLDGLEISPLADPENLRRGDKIDLRVTLAGAPVDDVVVTYAGRPRGTTDRDGNVRIKLREDGVQRIGASLVEPSSDRALDRVVYEAFLEFTFGGPR